MHNDQRQFRPPPSAVMRTLYRLGLGHFVGRLILLLTTTGRKSRLPRVTPLQYEEVDGSVYVASALGPRQIGSAIYWLIRVCRCRLGRAGSMGRPRRSPTQIASPISSLFSDAANTEVLSHAGLSRARALVFTIPDEAAGEMVVAAERDISPDLPTITIAETQEGAKQLAQLGAQHVIHPELEGDLEIVRHTLLQLGYPSQEIYRYTDAVRHDHYDMQIDTEEDHRLLHDLIEATNSIEISWLQLTAEHPLVGQTLEEANLRARTGVSVVAILRNQKLMANPKSKTVFEAEDRVGFIGDREQIETVEKLLRELDI